MGCDLNMIGCLTADTYNQAPSITKKEAARTKMKQRGIKSRESRRDEITKESVKVDERETREKGKGKSKCTIVSNKC